MLNMDLALEEFACFSLSDAAVLAKLPTELQLDIYRLVAYFCCVLLKRVT